MTTLYRMFERGVFCHKKLPMKGVRKSNGHQEKSTQSFRRTIKEHNQKHPDYANEFLLTLNLLETMQN